MGVGRGGEGLDVGEGPEHGHEVRGPEAGARIVEPDGQGQFGRLGGLLLNFQVTLLANQVIE